MLHISLEFLAFVIISFEFYQRAACLFISAMNSTRNRYVGWDCSSNMWTFNMWGWGLSGSSTLLIKVVCNDLLVLHIYPLKTPLSQPSHLWAVTSTCSTSCQEDKLESPWSQFGSFEKFQVALPRISLISKQKDVKRLYWDSNSGYRNQNPMW